MIITLVKTKKYFEYVLNGELRIMYHNNIINEKCYYKTIDEKVNIKTDITDLWQYYQYQD